MSREYDWWDEYLERDSLRRESEQWDRRHFNRSMDNVSDTQRDPDPNYLYEVGPGGVFSAGSFGSGAEYYSITGMYENPLLEKHHRGKGPRSYKRADDRIHDEVCYRLTEHPLVDASLMDVHVKDGEVTLSGRVVDRRMKYLAEDVVDEVAGVKDIHNQLKVSREEAA
jgi:hypothetical protein